MIRRTYYGWFDPKRGEFRVSAYPADAPVRPSIALPSKADVMALIERKRAVILWWPELPAHVA